jgi:hypothetical protein
MVLLKVILPALAAFFLAVGCGSGNTNNPRSAANEAPVAVQENGAAVTGETTAPQASEGSSSITSEQAAVFTGSSDSLNDTQQGKCIYQYSNLWYTLRQMITQGIIVEDTCKHLLIEDSGGTQLIDVKLKDDDCKLTVEFDWAHIHIDTTYTFCNNGE